jgi:signal transduction histidine kinase/ligand-binding sensor domain-containing protein
MHLAGSNRELQSLPFRVVIVAVLSMFVFAKPGYGVNPERSISQYGHSAWRLQEGFFGGSPHQITQTKDGYIWIATDSELVRFDGIRFTPWSFPVAAEVKSRAGYAILGTTDGSLWIGDLAGGLLQWNHSKLTRYAVPGNRAILAILEGGNGKVWAALGPPHSDAKSICEAGEGKLQCYDLGKSLLGECCDSLAKGANGDLWLGGESLIRWQPQSAVKEVFRVPDIRPLMEGVLGVAALPDGSIWIGVDTPGKSGGLQHYENGKRSHFHSPSWDSNSVGVGPVLLDSHGALWAGSDGKGLYRIWNGRVDHFGSEDGLSENRVRGLFEDHEGNVWVATRGGVDCFRDLAVTTYSSHEGLRATEYDTVFATRDGTLWIGGDRSLDQLREGQIVLSLGAKDLPGEQITSVLNDSHGRMWVGIDQTLNILKEKKFTEIKRPDGKSLGMVVGLTEDHEGAIWAEVSAKPRQLVEIRNAKVTQMFAAPEMPAARKVAADTHGGLWLGLVDGGLARYLQGKVDIFRFSDKQETFVNEVGVERDDTVLGATGYGLIGWRDGKQRIFNTRDGLPCNDVNTFIRDNDGALWLYTQCGLIRITAEEFENWWRNPATFPKLRLFDSVDGVQPKLAPFQQSARTSDGKLWFVNQAALQMIDPTHLTTNTIPPPVHVEELILAGKSYSTQASLHLPPSTSDLSIRYTALSYVAPQKVFFRYMLEGQDKVWQEASTRREAFYTNLRPGPYRFHVIACNNEGLWNQVGDSFSFTITPAYYQTEWFEIVCGLALVGVLWTLYVLRLKQVTLQIQGRLGARMEERERIARELHDTLLQGFSGLMLRLQAVMRTLPADQQPYQVMEQVLDKADEVLFEGRQSVRDLREKGSVKAELSDALSHCGEELALGHSSRFSLRVLGDLRPLRSVVFDESYRIAREALINAFQHSKASNIEAEIMYSGSTICIRIRDDGVGMDADVLTGGREGHWGFSGMRERARKIGAKVNIWSKPDAGTEVELVVPAEVAYSSQATQTLWRRIKQAVGRSEETKL